MYLNTLHILLGVHNPQTPTYLVKDILNPLQPSLKTKKKH